MRYLAQRISKPNRAERGSAEDLWFIHELQQAYFANELSAGWIDAR